MLSPHTHTHVYTHTHNSCHYCKWYDILHENPRISIRDNPSFENVDETCNSQLLLSLLFLLYYTGKTS